MLRNVAVGNAATSKKSAERRWSSRAGVAGGDARHVEGDLDRRLGGIVGDDDGAGDPRQAHADLRHHEVASDELDAGVAGIDHPLAGDGDLVAVHEAGGRRAGGGGFLDGHGSFSDVGPADGRRLR